MNTRNPFRTIALGMVIAIVLAFSATASADPGMYFDPQRPGHAINLADAGPHGLPVTWYLYDADGETAFLVGGQNCTSLPCVVTLHEPTAPFMGAFPADGISVDLGPLVGFLELRSSGTGIRAVYDLTIWTWPLCEDASPPEKRGLECVGDLNLSRLAG